MKVALVTGASRGIGRATALALAAKGFSLFVAAEGTQDELEAVVADCRQSGSQDARWGIADLSRPGAAEAMVEAALSAFGRIDVLVNNAGIRCRKAFGTFSREDFAAVVEVNLAAAFFASQQYYQRCAPGAAVGLSMSPANTGQSHQRKTRFTGRRRQH